jgi:alkaline phosphatase D
MSGSPLESSSTDETCSMLLPPSSRLIFGSCTSLHHKRQPLWPTIQKRNATAFVWGGDAIYADDRVEWNGIFYRRLDATPEYLRHLYQQQRKVPGYQALLESNISIFGTIDDHDYGINNGDRTFRWKGESGLEFVNFLGLSKDSAMFQRASEGLGVYGVQVYDFSRERDQRVLSDREAGLDPDAVPIPNNLEEAKDPLDDKDKNNNKLVAVFVLDIRTNKTPWNKSFPKRYSPDSDGDFLGEQQWKWFETAIARSEAAVNVVVTGLQVHAERFYDASIVENWSGFPKAQHRLHQALLQPNVQAPILISGDVHHAQLLRKDCHFNSQSSTKSSTTRTTTRPLFEITTSGMTHSWGATSCCGRANFNPACRVYYFNAIYGLAFHLAHWISPWNDLLLDKETNRLQYSLALNVAELDFDWESRKVSVNILGKENRMLLHQDWSFDDLTGTGRATTTTSTSTAIVDGGDVAIVQKKLQDLSILRADEEEWICVPYRGLPGRIHFAFGVVSPIVLLFVLGTLPLALCILGCRAVVFRRKETSSTRSSSSKSRIAKGREERD